MLREIFFGKENAELAAHTHLVDAEPREIYVISCLLVPIIGIGLYPRIMTDTYRELPFEPSHLDLFSRYFAVLADQDRAVLIR